MARSICALVPCATPSAATSRVYGRILSVRARAWVRSSRGSRPSFASSASLAVSAANIVKFASPLTKTGAPRRIAATASPTRCTGDDGAAAGFARRAGLAFRDFAVVRIGLSTYTRARVEL